MSTAGLATQDFSHWPAFSRLLLFYAAIIGGCSASTSGGVKVSRVVVLLKVCWQEIKRTLHPRMVSVITMSGRPVPAQAIIGVGRYFFLYFIVFIALSMLYSLTGSDMLESMATVVVFLSNVGSAYGIMGEGTTFEALSSFGYLILYVTMIMGRIELFAFVMFLHLISGRRNAAGKRCRLGYTHRILLNGPYGFLSGCCLLYSLGNVPVSGRRMR